MKHVILLITSIIFASNIAFSQSGENKKVSSQKNKWNPAIDSLMKHFKPDRMETLLKSGSKSIELKSYYAKDYMYGPCENMIIFKEDKIKWIENVSSIYCDDIVIEKLDKFIVLTIYKSTISYHYYYILDDFKLYKTKDYDNNLILKSINNNSSLELLDRGNNTTKKIDLEEIIDFNSL